MDIVCERFGLSAPPFLLTPDERFYFPARAHAQAAAGFLASSAAATPLIVLTGEIGVGKTTVARWLQSALAEQGPVANLRSSRLEALELLQQVLADLGGGHAPAGLDAAERALSTLAASLATAGRRATVCIDEAQNLPPDTLRRLAHWVQAGPPTGLRWALFGQPELLRAISVWPAAIAQAALRLNIAAMVASETRAYVEHRLRRVGWRQRPVFDDSAFEALQQVSAGVPRRINQLCQRLLVACCVSGVERIDEALVRRTAGDLGQELATGRAPQAAVAPAPAPAPAMPVTPATPAPSSTRATVALSPARPVAPVRPTARGLLLCLVGGWGDEVQAASAMQAFSQAGERPVQMVRVFDSQAPVAEAVEGPKVREPVQLNVDGGRFGRRGAALVQALEGLFERSRAEAVMVFGGGELSLCAATLAGRLGLSVLQGCAGRRLGEAAAAADALCVLPDHLCGLAFAPDEAAARCLASEGVPEEKVRVVGSLRVDAALRALRALPELKEDGVQRHGLVVLNKSWHLGDRALLGRLVALLRQVGRDLPLVWPMSLRAAEHLDRVGQLPSAADAIACVAPMPHLEWIARLRQASCVITDSWGVQEEAALLGVPCLSVGHTPLRPGGSRHDAALGDSATAATRRVWELLFNGSRDAVPASGHPPEAGGRLVHHFEVWQKARVTSSRRVAPESWDVPAAVAR